MPGSVLISSRSLVVLLNDLRDGVGKLKPQKVLIVGFQNGLAVLRDFVRVGVKRVIRGILIYDYLVSVGTVMYIK